MSARPFLKFKGKFEEDMSAEQSEAESARSKAENLPKEFEYYCPGCLFQTNEPSRTCPKCGERDLERTGTRQIQVIIDHGINYSQKVEEERSESNKWLLIMGIGFLIILIAGLLILLDVI